ncbi:MAG TPA: tol-pal system protein YbgF [Thiothrix sp.]|nr:tol-pal system protein YbgF [Thiothrix sp.]
MESTMKVITSISHISLASLLMLSAISAHANSDAFAELYQRIEIMGKEINQLRGENQILRHDLTQLKESQKRAFLALDERMNAESKNRSEDAPLRTTPETVKPIPPQRQPVQPVKRPISTQPTIVTHRPVTGVKAEYNQAYEALKQNRQAGVTAFKRFLAKYPNSPLAENAHYWIGEAWYSQRNYRQAIDSFIVVLNKYKKGRKAPDAAVKLGYSFYALKDWNMARRTFNDVLRYFPNSHAAQLAKARLDKMRSEGH